MPENIERGTSPAQPVTVTDEQTGRQFVLEPEKLVDTLSATASVIYLLVMLVGFLWLLFDIWVGNLVVFQTFLRYSPETLVALRGSRVFHLLAYTFIGGGLGGVIGGYCSFSSWHCERRAFGWRFIWKYITFPWLGGTLAVVVYAIMASGVAVIGGSVASGEGSPDFTQSLFSLSIGALVGYGSPRVMKWLDAQVDRMFKVDRQAATATETKAFERASLADPERAVDGCDVEVTAGKITDDRELPAAAGGVA
jgi:hypothetical protein